MQKYPWKKFKIIFVKLRYFVFYCQSVVFRIPIIGGYTDDDENLESLYDLVPKYRPVKIELIKEHNLGKNKYISLSKEPLELNSVSDKDMEHIKLALSNVVSIPIEICKV